MATVVRLGNPETTYEYTLPAVDALIAAYEQYANDNWNTWQYKPMTAYPIELGQYHYFLGDFAVRKPKTETE